MIIDFHSHILPAIDDGSRSIRESLEMLHLIEKQGVQCLIATPHFYPNQIGLAEFLRSRRNACQKLAAHRTARDLQIKCGAEVAFFRGIGKTDMLDSLCIENTNLLLLEMPFRNWTTEDYAEIQGILHNGIVPILAHVERYDSLQRKRSAYYEILQLPVHLQMNASALCSFRKRRTAFKIVEFGKPILLGSDCHNMKGRCPNLPAGRKVLQKKYGEAFLADLDTMGEILINGNCHIEERDT